MIDGCLFINLPYRTDRLAQFQSSCATLGSLGIRPERIEAVHGKSLPGFAERPWFRKRLTEKRKNAWGGKAGCTLSHRKAIAEAKSRGWKQVLILEDDCVIDPNSTSQWEALREILAELPKDWIAVYLYGHHPVLPARLMAARTDTACYEICGASSTTAYLLNGRYFNVLLALLPTEETVWSWTARHKTIDRWYSRTLCLLGRVFALSPFGVDHCESLSDITTSGISDDIPGFTFVRTEGDRDFFLKRWLTCVQQKTALEASWFRFVYKCLHGL